MKQLLLITVFFIGTTLFAQSPRLHILENPDTLNKKRLYISAGSGLAIYSGFSIALWNSWYKQSELSGFHTFDDAKEWNQMDKAGHFYTAWLESHYSFQGAKWTGMKRKNALIVGAAVGIGLQTTIEVMDGFSADWGFSWSDMAANGLGTAFWLTQELIWEEQRIKMKFSASPQSYSTAPISSVDGGSTTSLNERAIELYGDSFGTSVFKDYNAQTTWVSANIYSFLPNKKTSNFPKWLNIAAGYGSGNLYGGFENEWETDDETKYILSDDLYPRYRQFYLSLDIELTKIPTKSRFLKTLFGVVNWIKIPAPTLELNTLGKVEFHPVYW
jgi:uncharacterized protein YfiM (DUF2279 family)